MRLFRAAAAVFVIAFTVNVATLSPSLFLIDSPPLTVAAHSLGNAHPPGFPLFVMLTHLASRLPFGSVAWRTNLASAVFAALACAAMAAIVGEIVRLPRRNVLAASMLFGGLLLAFSRTLWAYATITEVYALQAFLVVLILHLYTTPAISSRYEQSTWNRWRALVLGLALGNHLTTVLLVPAALLVGALPASPERGDTSLSEPVQSHRPGIDGRLLVQQLAWLGLGLCLYLIIPLRALANPPVNWGNAVTVRQFWWLVSGQLYQDYLQFNLAALGEPRVAGG